MEKKQEILNEMLNAISNNYDKKEGSFIYDALAPAAEQFAIKDQEIKAVSDKLSIENLSGDELTQRVRERTGIIRRPATYAIGKVTVFGTGTINEGDLFETEAGVQFESIETKEVYDTGKINIKAMSSGEVGVVPAEAINLFPVTLSGFNDVINEEPTYDGFEAESDEDLILRYYEAIRRPATSGNRSHYIGWAKEIEGVGKVRVFPLWLGDNTVRIVIINANRAPASAELVGVVQNYIDPGVSGTGDGKAPIGAYATVESANGIPINIQVSINATYGTSESDILSYIEDNIREYLYDIAFEEEIVSFARTGAAILDSIGVLDYSNLEINGGTSNVSIEGDQVAILGTVSINVL